MFLEQQQQVMSDAALGGYSTMLPAALQAVTQATPLYTLQPSSSILGDPPGLYGSSSGQVSPAAAYLQQQQQQQQQGLFPPAWELQAAAAAAAAAEELGPAMSTGPTMQGGWQY
jgi:hypothetical protein